MQQALVWVYSLVSLGTAFYLTFMDGYVYNAWNWLIAVPVNLFLGSIWPIYWGILHWVM
jgi:hypothetical protein